METVTTTVRPCPTTLGQTTKLSQIDQIAPRDYVASYFFFRLPTGTDNTEVFRILEEGFHTTVQQIPDLMCCICECDGGRNELELRLHGDSGATITMKDFTSSAYDGQWTPGTFDQLERDHFPLQSLPQAHILAQTEFPDQVCLPTLAMQANFIEGGLVLTGCLHHTVCDGTGNLVFFSILAQHIAAATAGQVPDPLTDAAISFLDRKSVIDPELDVKLDQFPDWKLVQDPNSFLDPTDFDPELNPPVEFATYYISEAKAEALRQRMITQAGHLPSTTEAVCAFMWKHVVKARNTDYEKYPETKLSITVNTRARMRNPVCSPAYWGNLSEPNAVARMPTRQFCDVSASPKQLRSSHKSSTRSSPPQNEAIITDLASEIFEPTPKPSGTTTPSQSEQQTTNTPPNGSIEDALPTDLAAEIFQPSRSPKYTTTPHFTPTAQAPNDPASLSLAALRVKQAISAVDSTAVRRLVGLLSQMSTATSLTWNVDRWPGPDMLIVCLNSAKFNHINFGDVLGYSEASRLTVGKPDGKPDGRCFIWPPRRRDGRGMEVCLQYDVETLGRLRRDGGWREFFEWRN